MCILHIKTCSLQIFKRHFFNTTKPNEFIALTINGEWDAEQRTNSNMFIIHMWIEAEGSAENGIEEKKKSITEWKQQGKNFRIFFSYVCVCYAYAIVKSKFMTSEIILSLFCWWNIVTIFATCYRFYYLCCFCFVFCPFIFAISEIHVETN